MLVLLVRHGHAGTKRQWIGPDSCRPLNEQGLAESEMLARLLAPYAPVRILSSPFLRCLQSVEPLGQALGLAVESSPSLTPEAGAAANALALNVASTGSAPVVLCTHGEVIRDMQSGLGKHGPTNFNSLAPREKASIWVLDRRRKRFVSATYLPPPSIEVGGEGGGEE